MCLFRPLTRLPPSKPHAPFFGRFDRLTIHYHHTRFSFSSVLLTNPNLQMVIDHLPCAILAQFSKIPIDRFPRQILVWQGSLLTPYSHPYKMAFISSRRLCL